MQIGFEEDSPFYTAPSEKKSEDIIEAKKVKQEESISVKEAVPVEEEDGTTFSYSREDGE